jgi:pimeloyl-ACP methyl ester carboxylesterase
MSVFLNTRALSGGGNVAPQVAVCTANVGGAAPMTLDALKNFIHGKDVLIATHGFNVNQASGIQCLSAWEPLLLLPSTAVFVGLLWPGDSDSVYALSYPVEPKNAMDAGAMAGRFVDATFGSAASVSLVSHSLGARVVLQAVATMNRRVRRLILMAGAISDDCLTNEFAVVPGKVDSIALLSSLEDTILEWAFPAGDFVTEILGKDHPWWESALGRSGPRTAPPNLQPPYAIPTPWNYGHLNYLQTDPPAQAPIPSQPAPLVSGSVPRGGEAGWQQAWSAAFVSSRFV